ncbi:hypothetical protein ACQ4PT_024010 [Festuca glaucescens]
MYKVGGGGLDAWAPPPGSKPDVYVQWGKSLPFKLGDSLFFLYPPSQDSAVQVGALRCTISVATMQQRTHAIASIYLVVSVPLWFLARKLRPPPPRRHLCQSKASQFPVANLPAVISPAKPRKNSEDENDVQEDAPILIQLQQWKLRIQKIGFGF